MGGATTSAPLIDWAILGPALLAGLLVLVTHIPLGMQVLARGIVFIDLAIAQIAGIGGLAAHAWADATHGPAIDGLVQVAAALAALLGAAVLTWTERRWPDIQEALIGVLFVVASCLGLLLLADNPHGGEHLQDLLAGQILWVRPDQLAAVAALSAAVLLAWWWGGPRGTQPGRLGRLGFYVLFALSVTASVQLVGVYLVFTSLIVPALATRRLAGWARLLAAYGLGAAGYAGGLLLSARYDWPSGAVVVLCMAVLAPALAWWLGRGRPAPAAR